MSPSPPSDQLADRFRRFAQHMANVMGTAWAFGIAVGIILVWATTGPLFHFSDTWQLVVNTGTTVVTFMMVFLIQATQNRDAAALHLKLDELIRSNRHARNALVGLEELTEDELLKLHAEFRRLRSRSDPKAAGAATPKTDAGAGRRAPS
jgi:low affinity Fe/Cu permease